jgi:membrane protein
MFMPNTKVNFRSALVGGAVGGIMWATMGAIFTTFILFATRTQQIYAGFAVAITTLIWLYLNWLILLIGAQLAFYHQNPAFLRIGRQEPRLSNSMRERLALDIMFRSITSSELSSKLSIPSIALAPVSGALESAGLLSSMENEELLPGREMARISLKEILDVVRVQGETGSHRDPSWSPTIDTLGTELDSAVAKKVADRSLSDLLDEFDERNRG